MRRGLCAVLLLLALAASGCGQNRIVYAQPDAGQPARQAPRFPSYQGGYTTGTIPAEWVPLYQRLRAPKPTRPVKPTTPSKPKPLVYAGVITPENVEKCRAFLEANKAAFEYAERTAGVPRQIAVSLLFVETRLGTFLGKEKAFYTLASMASARRPEAISGYVAKLPGASAPDRLGWIQTRMEQRSDWAYKELEALLKNLRSSGEDPLVMPGSIYGAIGMCQFMPTNIDHYGADGDGDGVVNLFTVPDAVASLSNYLAKHGWNKAATRAQKQKVIKSYNRIDIYANTILGLAEAQGYAAE